MLNLTGNSALDVTIGLSFVFLLFSVLCSAVQEGIAGIFDLRAAKLEDGLRSLLQDDGAAEKGGAPAPVGPSPPSQGGGAVGDASTAQRDGAELRDLTKELLGHGLIRGLYKDSRFLFRRHRRGPSYIPPSSFALALLNVIAPTNSADPLREVRDEISKANVPAGTKNALLTLANGVASDRDHLRKLVEEWFDSAMARVSGWYKRKTQIIICVLSLLVAVGLNVNTIGIADRLAHDESIRATVVQQAAKSQPQPGASLKTAANDIQKLGLPIGWSKTNGDPSRADFKHHFWRTTGGWLITFIALSLGAPFWFDTLSKLSRLRNTGPPPAGSSTSA